MRRYAEITVNGILRATASEQPGDPEDAPGEMWRDYRIFDDQGRYSSQHSAGQQTFEDTLKWLAEDYEGEVVVEIKATE